MFLYYNHPTLLGIFNYNIYKKKKKKPTAWYFYRSKQNYQYNQIKVLEITPHTYGHLILRMNPKPYNGRKNQVDQRPQHKLHETEDLL